MKTRIDVRRVYGDESENPVDGYRVYVDRLWPRGESRARFQYDMWAKQVAPSTELREWFHADPQGRWEEFSRKYSGELAGNPAVDLLVHDLKGRQHVTLLYSSKDTEHNNAVVLADYLRRELN